MSTTHAFPFHLFVQTAFLNRTVPPVAQNKSFKVSFKIAKVTIGPEADGSNAFAGIDPTTRTALQASLDLWANNLNGSYQHNPGTPAAIKRLEQTDLGPAPLSIDWPVGEIPMPNEFTIYLDLEAQVELAGQVVQLVPGAGYRQNNPLRMGLLFNRSDLSVDQQVDIGWAFVSDPRFAYEASGLQYWMTGTASGSCRQAWGRTLNLAGQLVFNRGWRPASRGLVPLQSLYALPVDGSGAAGVYGTANPFIQGLDMVEWPDVLYSDRQGLDFLDDSDISANSALMMVRNGGMVSVGEMGNLLIAPWRTLSLFDGVHPPAPTSSSRAMRF